MIYPPTPVGGKLRVRVVLSSVYLYDHPTGDKEVAGMGVGATMHHFKSGDYL